MLRVGSDYPACHLSHLRARAAGPHAPALNHTYTAVRGDGARRNGEPIAVTRTEELRHALVATGFSYHRNEPGYEDNVDRIARMVPLCRDLRRLGSAQLDLCLTAAGTFDGYWEMYLQPYDVAAGGLIVREAGGRVTDLAGGDDWVREGQILAMDCPTILKRIGSRSSRRFLARESGDTPGDPSDGILLDQPRMGSRRFEVEDSDQVLHRAFDPTHRLPDLPL